MARSPALAFDAGYYARFYESRRTRVQGPKEVAHLASGIVAMVEWLGTDIRSVLDVGAGPGLWRDWFAAQRPKARYLSTDVSPYACETYGHQRRDIVTWRARTRFDLVVCQGVLPYLSRTDAARAVANLGAMTRGFLYLEAVTAEDLRTVCDGTKTDGDMRGHPASFYRKHLDRWFVPLAFGLFMAKSNPVVLYELERGR